MCVPQISPLPTVYRDHYMVFVPRTNREHFVSNDPDYCQEIADDWNVDYGYFIDEEAIVVHVEEVYTQYIVAEQALKTA